MAANSKQKLKLLYLYRMLSEETDAKKGLTMADIIERLAELGVDAERKSIYRDLDVLREFGLEIYTLRRAPVEYTLKKTGLSASEIAMLIDAVQSSRFLTEHMSDRLSRSLRQQASVREQKLLGKRVHVLGRIKSQNESVFHNVDTIHEAMHRHRKIQFLYYKLDTGFERQIQHGGKPYVHTPVRLVFVDGVYYLVTWSDAHESFVQFRVDRMQLLQVTDEPATRSEAIANYGYEEFGAQAFGMFSGDIIHPVLRVKANAMDVVADRMGSDISVKRLSDEEADVRVSVRKNAQFFGWVAGMNGSITIVSPNSLVQEYRDWLKSLLEM